MNEFTEWTIDGSEGLPIFGRTHIPEGNPRGIAIVVHGFMGTMDRNIIPAISDRLRKMGLVVHRFNLAHCGVENGADIVTKHDKFTRDTWRFTHEDIRAVLASIGSETLAGKGLPMVLVGHSRGGGGVVGYAGRARREGWAEPDAVVSLAGIGWYSILADEVRRQIENNGFYEVKSKRAEGGAVRCGPSWFAEHDEQGDVFAEDAKLVRCPVLLVHGEADSTVPLSQAERVKSLLEAGDCPRVELATIPGADHNFNSLGIGLERENARSPEVLRACKAISSFLDEVNPYR